MNEAIDRLLWETTEARPRPAGDGPRVSRRAPGPGRPRRRACPAPPAGAAPEGGPGLHRRLAPRRRGLPGRRAAGRGPRTPTGPRGEGAAAAAPGPQAADGTAEAWRPAPARRPPLREASPRPTAGAGQPERRRPRRPRAPPRGAWPGDRARDPRPRASSSDRPARACPTAPTPAATGTWPGVTAEDLDALEPADQVRLRPAGRRHLHHPAGRQRDGRARHRSRAARPSSTWRPSGPSSTRRLSARSRGSMARTPERSRHYSSRRPSLALGLVLGAAALSLPGTSAAPQEPPPPVEQIVIGGVTPRFAVPDCVPRRPDEASQAACRTITQVLRNDLRFEGLFQFVPDSLLERHPAAQPRRAEVRGLEGHRREDPGRDAGRGRGRGAHGRGARLLRGLRRHHARPPLLGQARQPPRLRAPGLRRHHDPHPVPGRRAHADRLRLGPGRHEGEAVEGALHRRLRRLQPAPRHGQRFDQHPSRLAPRRGRPRLRLVPPGLAAPLPRQDLRGPERRQPQRREGGQPGPGGRVQPRREEPRLREHPRRATRTSGWRTRTAAAPGG